jgi:parallel beta-helix repeat protein
MEGFMGLREESLMRKFLVVLLAAGAMVAAQASTAQGAGTVTVSNLKDSGPGSLRSAITAANRHRDTTTIDFSVHGTIGLRKSLPAVRERTVIDGTSAPTYVAGGPPVVAVAGNRIHGCGCNADDGVRFGGGSNGSQLLGLSVINAKGSGVALDADSITLNSNYIGLDLAGHAAGNRRAGVHLMPGSAKNKIGLNKAHVSGAVANVISGNRGPGLQISNSSGNTVVANRIGTNAAGTVATANHAAGIEIAKRSKNNVIGGTEFVDASTGQANNPTGTEGTVTPVFVVPPLGNLVSGNRGTGIRIVSGSKKNVLNGNFVGTTADGDSALGNGGDGVRIRNADRNSLIGCRFVNNPFVYYNVLGANGGNGLRITDSNDVTVQANFFGVGANNTNLLPNAGDGILVDGSSKNVQVGGVIPLGNVAAANDRNGIEVAGKARGFVTFNTFGGLLAFKGAAPNRQNGILITSTGGNNLVRTNVMSGNRRNGIKLAGSARGVTVDPNVVGATTTGASALPNGGSGLKIGNHAHDNVIGGTRRSVIPQNTFSGNTGFGITITGHARRNRVIYSDIGTNALGAQAVPNQAGGILFDGYAHNNVVGLSDAARPNVLISGNTGNGVTLTKHTHSNRVTNSYIGLSRTRQALPNSGLAIVDNGTANTFDDIVAKRPR